MRQTTNSPQPQSDAVKALAEQFVKQGYPPLLKQAHVEALTGLAATTLEQARLTGRLGLPFVRLGRSIRYPLDSTAAFIAGLQRFTSTTEADFAPSAGRR
jgi:hypothetical protein